MGNDGDPPPYKLLSFQTLKKNYGLFPLATLVGMALTFYATSATYFFFTRDIVYIKGTKPINMRMDLLNPYHLKLFVINEKLVKGEALHEAYEAMLKKEKEEYKLLGGDDKKKK